MRLIEAMLEANHRALAGDASAGLHPDENGDELPLIALTCIDPRLNAFFPNILGIPADQFIWMRNAGNIITGPLSSTMRSLALACAVKGGKEIAVIGHTDCQVAKTTTMQLLEKFKALGVDRAHLPENLNDYFGMFATERQNVIKGCDFVRQSPLIGPNIPVHGLLTDTETGRLDWVVNGYEVLRTSPQQFTGNAPQLGGPGSLGKFDAGEMKFPSGKIGEWASNKLEEVKAQAEQKIQPIMEAVKKPLPQTPAGAPPKIPLPPPIRPRFTGKR
jgi:carbonic anhydrase